MKTIKCNCGSDILVDDEDFDEVSKFSWVHGENCVFTTTTTGTCSIGKMILFETLPTGMTPDHIDRNVHNNQKSNLRFATRSQNAMNRGVMSTNRSGFKGVSFSNKARKWAATITRDYKQRHLGYFKTAEEAAHAYDKAAKLLHGEFAFLNFPHENKQEVLQSPTQPKQ